MYGPQDLLFAGLTGIAVVAITVLGDRLGGRLGGLLATAPVTTSAAHVVLVAGVSADQAALKVLQGAQALLAVTFAIPAFFYAVKFTRGHPSNHRLAAGLASFVGVFLPMTLLFAVFPLPTLSAFVLLFALHIVLSFNFMREPLPRLRDELRAKPRRPVRELLARFASGVVVVLLIRSLVTAAPALAGALAVVPAVFLVSITVLGLTHNAPFAARASQAGLFGATAVAFFVLVIALVLHLDLRGGIWTALPFGWLAYLGTLSVLGRLHGRIQRLEPGPRVAGDAAAHR
jgi:hypothetical protein